MLCRVIDATLSLLLVILLSPESRSGPFGPKPSFGLLAFGLVRYVPRDAMLLVRYKPLILQPGAVGLGEHIPYNDVMI